MLKPPQKQHNNTDPTQHISPTFCVLPFMHLATNASGKYRVCCNSTPGKNHITDSDGNPMKLDQHDINQVWNTEYYQKIRSQLIKGERPEICQRCFSEEDAGVTSARQSYNQSWFNDTIDIKTTYDHPDIRYIDLRLGNLCNLKCRMCNPYASSQWVKEWNDVVETAELVPNESLPPDEIQRLSKMDWFENPKVWDNISKIADCIEEIYLTGGEPTLATKQYDLFQYLRDKDFAKDIKLKYNTNLTNIPDRMVWHWYYFKQVKINASIDAVGELDRYVRYPSSWNKVEENFKKLRRLRNTRLQIHTTVQTYNILALDKLYEWCDSILFEDVYLNILNHPKCLNIKTLPKSIKQEVESRLSNFMNRPKVKQMIQYMNSEDWYDSYWNEFVDYTNVLDKSRNENILELVPEFKDYWHD